ncbi:MAG: hypothetical protein QUS07_01385 [Methanothrix sp.]|mgnify:CR=1 FL=1|nr:hypothetical protein [Methanothrix sp.]
MRQMLYSTLLAIMLIVLSFDVQGQDQLSSGINTEDCSDMQYYKLYDGPVSNIHISDSMPFNISGKAPISLYGPSFPEGVMYSDYQSSLFDHCSLWIQGLTDWTQNVVVPKGATISLVAISPAGFNGLLSELHPDGRLENYTLNFYPLSQLTFYADTIGRHVLFFAVAGCTSNKVEINVVANCTSKKSIPTTTIYYVEESGGHGIYVPRFSAVGQGSASCTDCCSTCNRK